MAEFGAIASALRSEVQAFYADRGQPLAGPAGHNTLETNSGLVERRGRPLLRFLGFGEGADERPLAAINLVDVGCGFGALALLFAAEGARVTGVDPNEQRFAVGRAVAEQFGLPVEFVRGEIQALPLAEKAYDLAVINNALCYVVGRTQRNAGLAEVRRVLRPDGQVVIRNPNRWSLRDQFTGLPVIHWLPPDLATAAAGCFGRPRSSVRLASLPAAAHELRAAGFSRVKSHSQAGSVARTVLRPVARYQHLTATRPAD